MSRWPSPVPGGLVPPGADGRRRLTFRGMGRRRRRRGGVVQPRWAWPRATWCACSSPRRSTTPCATRPQHAHRGHHHRREPPHGRGRAGLDHGPGAPRRDRRRHRRRGPRRRAAGVGPVCWRATRWPSAWEHAAPPARALDAHDPVAIVWTSGSTGVPKGAVFDHANLRAVAAGTDVLSHPGDRRLSPLPFPHVGYMTRAWDEIAHGVTTVITPQPWTAASAIELLDERAGHRRAGRAHPVGPDARPPRPRRRRPLAPAGSPAPGRRGSRPSWSVPCATAWDVPSWCATPRPSRRSGPEPGPRTTTRSWPRPSAGPCPGSSSRWSTTTARRCATGRGGEGPAALGGGAARVRG